MAMALQYVEATTSKKIAYCHTPGETPGILFCGGFQSDMTGTKARAMEEYCKKQGRAFTRFDYTGHGASSGDFVKEGSIGVWKEDTIAMIDHLSGPLVLVGSSMGGWLMVLAALARPERIRGLVGIAAAPDFTEDVLWTEATTDQRDALLQHGHFRKPSEYSNEDYIITRKLIEEAREKHLVLRAPIDFDGPVHLLHGQADADIPWQTSLGLSEALTSKVVTIELIKSGDHRLSKPPELERIFAAMDRVVSLVESEDT